MVESPCTDDCYLDEECDHCLGCGRKLEEIINWSNMSKEEKEEVISRISDD
jgi:predicted Fe-S protein YdhL (DUF1289 family)